MGPTQQLDRPAALQVWLADFEATRNEIHANGARQALFIQLQAAAAAAVLGFVGADLESREMALFGVLGISFLAWLSYHGQESGIFKLATYERDVIRPAVVQLVGTDDVLPWQEYYPSRVTAYDTAIYILSLMALLLGPSLVAAGLSLWIHPTTAWRYMVWVPALLVLLFWPLGASLGFRRRFAGR